MRNNGFCVLVGVALSLGQPATGAFAVCAQNSAGQADQDLWNLHGCWRDYYLWQYRAYDVRGSDWGNRGFFDACNVNLEYPKHWNATYLLNYGLADNLAQSLPRSVDYEPLSNAAPH